MAKILFRTTAGRFGTLVGGAVMAAALWFGFGGAMRAAPPVPDPTTCLPTCAVNDGRFLVVAGDDPTTLAAQELVIGMRYTQFSGDANFDIFDADRDRSNWDVPWADGDNSVPDPDAPKLIIEVFNDPGGIGGTGVAVATFTPTPGCVPGVIEKCGWETYFPAANNTWTGLTFPQQAAAFNPVGGYYQYAFHFKGYSPAVDKGWNAFKFRAAGTVLILGQQVIGFLGGMNIPNDVATIYPNFPANLNNSTYDGSWLFQANLPPFLKQVTLFDGDMDFGAENCAYNDTDDPDSSGIPAFAVGSAAVAEGVAAATGIPAAAACNGVDFSGGTRTGLPADDNSSDVWKRSPGIVPNGVAYQLQAPASASYPTGQIFLNQNVSGNKEWEQFRIQLVAPGDFPLGLCPAGGYPADVGKGYLASDCRTDELPGGAWEVQLRGMDLSNLNFFFFDFDFQPPDPNVYSVGRLVWYDADKDGVQDLCAGVPCAPELGIANVAYTVYDGPLPGGQVVRTGLTNSVGEFLETGLPAADYTVVVDAGNFASGQPLEGLSSTTGGETENGVEVGLPICTDVGVPAGCGQPGYAEAIFGYVKQSDDCIVTPIKGGTPFVGASHTIVPNPPGSPAGAITLRTTLNRERFVDNSYGTSAPLTGWPGSHTFGNLTGSDKMQLAMFDTNDVKVLWFTMDYISASAAPGAQGYKTLGVTGGEGSMQLGTAADILNVDTSLSVNFRDLSMPPLTVNSPVSDLLFTPPAAPYTPWNFYVYYDVTVRAGADPLSKFGAAGYGYGRLTAVHASPSKTGTNSEICVYGGGGGGGATKPIAVADSYSTNKNSDKNVSSPGVLGNDTAGPGGAMTAILVTGPSNGTLITPLAANGSFKYRPNTNYVGVDTFTYKANNANGDSNVATVTITVKK